MTVIRRDDDLDAIRFAAAAGTPLVVVSDGSLVGRVREALAVCGRPDRLREVRIRPWHGLFVDGAVRRIDPHASLGTDGWDPLLGGDLSGPYEGYAAVEAEAWAAGTVPDHPPLLDTDEAVSGSCDVSVVSRDVASGTFLALWLLRACAERARREGTTPPILVYDNAPQREGHGIREVAAGFGAGTVLLDEGHGGAVALGFGDHGAFVRDVLPAKEEWTARLKAFDEGSTLRVQGDFTYMIHPRGTTVACGARPDGGGGVGIWDVSPDGHCRMRTAWPGKAVDVEAAVRMVARGGVGALGEKSWGRVGDPSLAGFLRRIDEFECLAAEAEGRAADRVDAAFEAAVGGRRTREEIAHAVHMHPGRVRARRDFVVTWPAMAELLLVRRTRERVDAGERTLPLVADALGLDPAVARRLVGLREVPSIRMNDDDTPRPGYGLLSALGHDNLPGAGDAEGWRALSGLSAWLRTLAHPHPVGDGVAARLLVRIPGRDWTERSDRFRGPAGGEGPSAVDVGDMIVAFAHWLSMVMGRRFGRDVAMGIMTGHGSLLRLVQASRRWHADPMLRQGPNGLPLDLSWPVPFGTTELGRGFEARVLASVQELVDEGTHGPDSTGLDGLGHCVGGYGRRCVTGDSLIVSLRHGGARASTAELAPDPRGDWRIGGQPYALRQHRGHGNGMATAAAEDALESLRTRLDRDEVPVDPAALERRGEAPRSADARGAVCMHAAWRRIMPPAYARMGLREFLAALEGIDPSPRDAGHPLLVPMDHPDAVRGDAW